MEALGQRWVTRKVAAMMDVHFEFEAQDDGIKTALKTKPRFQTSLSFFSDSLANQDQKSIQPIWKPLKVEEYWHQAFVQWRYPYQGSFWWRGKDSFRSF